MLVYIKAIFSSEGSLLHGGDPELQGIERKAYSLLNMEILGKTLTEVGTSRGHGQCKSEIKKY